MPNKLNSFRNLPINKYTIFLKKIVAFCLKTRHESNHGDDAMNTTDEDTSLENIEIVPVLTVEDVNKALESSADSANELNNQLRDVFSLSNSSATLRLR